MIKLVLSTKMPYFMDERCVLWVHIHENAAFGG